MNQRHLSIDLTLPTSWDEVTRQQLIVIGHYFWKKMEHHLMGEFLVNLAGLTKFSQRRKATAIRCHMRPEDLFLVLEQVGHFRWIWEQNTREKQILQYIKVGRKKYYGPGDGFRDATFTAWQIADAYFIRYLEDRKPMDLCCYVAALYREKKKGQRIPFSESEAEQRAKLFLEKVSFDVLHAALIDHQGIRSWLVQHPEFEMLFTGEGVDSKIAFTHADVVAQLAQGDPTKYDQVDKVGLWPALRTLALFDKQRRLIEMERQSQQPPG